MSNWCSFEIDVKGKPENIKNFCKLFICDDEESKKQGLYFARSFVHYDRNDFEKDLDNQLEAGNQVNFSGDFAWSGWSCIFEGYPNKEEGLVTLEWACKEYDVEVEIETEEQGVCFEEEIIGNKDGVDYKLKDMPIYTCQKCGNKQAFPSHYDSFCLEEETCYECETEGEWEDKLTRMITKKVEMGNGNL